jgi:WhiB family redox-sensing transcriptional regulator
MLRRSLLQTAASRTAHFPGKLVIGRTWQRLRAYQCDPRKGELNVALTWIRTHDWDAQEWRDRAACRDTTPELFFPIGTTGGALDQIDAARRVCGQCPVTSECLEFALGTNQESGVWGGLTEEERRRLRKGAEATAQVG